MLGIWLNGRTCKKLSTPRITSPSVQGIHSKAASLHWGAGDAENLSWDCTSWELVSWAYAMRAAPRLRTTCLRSQTSHLFQRQLQLTIVSYLDRWVTLWYFSIKDNSLYLPELPRSTSTTPLWFMLQDACRWLGQICTGLTWSCYDAIRRWTFNDNLGMDFNVAAKCR